MTERAETDGRESAWSAVREALPARWRVGAVTHDPGVVRADGLMGAFSVTARGPHPGRGKMPVTVSGTGEDEVAALRDLDDRLRGVPAPDGSRMDELGRRLRLAYIDGAESWTHANAGRGMTRDELGALSVGMPANSSSKPVRHCTRENRPPPV
jgi:hypothetical protein